MCFFCPFSVLITLLGEESWSLCLSCICLLAMHTLICVTFSLPPGGRVWLRLLQLIAGGSSWTFLFTFFFSIETRGPFVLSRFKPEQPYIDLGLVHYDLSVPKLRNFMVEFGIEIMPANNSSCMILTIFSLG